MGNPVTYPDKVTMFIRRDPKCPFCSQLYDALTARGIYPEQVDASTVRELFIKSHKTVPQLYINGQHIGNASLVINKLSRLPAMDAADVIQKLME